MTHKSVEEIANTLVPWLFQNMDITSSASCWKLEDMMLDKVKDALQSERSRAETAEKKVEALRDVINILELDSVAHRQGQCSFQVLALCAEEEQRLKQYLLKALEST